MTEETNPRKHFRLVARSIAALNASGNTASRLDGAFGEFDIIGLSSIGVILVRVCEHVPYAAYLDDLRAVIAPGNCRKALHVWKPRRHLPEFLEL